MNPEKVAFTVRQNVAIDFARAHHKTQRRKGTVLPYIIHPIEVAYFCGLFWPKDEDLIIAAYLHDTLEDTEATWDSIEDLFGQKVAVLVDILTAEKKSSWRATRRGQIEKIKLTNNLDAVRLKAADMLSNASSIARDYRLFSEDAFTKFKSSTKEDTIWYYTTMFEIMASRLGNEPVLTELYAQIKEFSE